MGVGADTACPSCTTSRERDRRKRYMLSAAPRGRGIMWPPDHTIAFRTLMIAQHGGMASLGLALTSA